MKVLASATSTQAAQLLGGWWALMIALTYAIYLYKGEGDIFLPTISNTWDRAPGTYISRVGVNVGSQLFALLNLGVYYCLQPAPAGSKLPSNETPTYRPFPLLLRTTHSTKLTSHTPSTVRTRLRIRLDRTRLRTTLTKSFITINSLLLVLYKGALGF